MAALLKLVAVLSIIGSFSRGGTMEVEVSPRLDFSEKSTAVNDTSSKSDLNAELVKVEVNLGKSRSTSTNFKELCSQLRGCTEAAFKQRKSFQSTDRGRKKTICNTDGKCITVYENVPKTPSDLVRPTIKVEVIKNGSRDGSGGVNIKTDDYDIIVKTAAVDSDENSGEVPVVIGYKGSNEEEDSSEVPIIRGLNLGDDYFQPNFDTRRFQFFYDTTPNNIANDPPLPFVNDFTVPPPKVIFPNSKPVRDHRDWNSGFHPYKYPATRVSFNQRRSFERPTFVPYRPLPPPPEGLNPPPPPVNFRPPERPVYIYPRPSTRRPPFFRPCCKPVTIWTTTTTVKPVTSIDGKLGKPFAMNEDNPADSDESDVQIVVK